MNKNAAVLRPLPVILLLLALSACSGSPSSQNNPSGNGDGFTIGGTVSGLSGSGLVLQDNGGDNLSVTKNGTFTFATSVATGGAYKVTVMTQPSNPSQTCSMTNGSGTASANVTNIQVTCATNGSGGTGFTIGGTISGLSGSGLVLQDNGGDNLTVSENGSFTFATAIASGATYNVAVLTEPTNPTQSCSVANGSGTATANVGTVSITCSVGTLSVGGFVSGLSGTGMVLQDNSGDNLVIKGNGSFTFATLIASGAAYNVTVSTQPSGPLQTCSVTNGTGTATSNITNVQVICPAVFHTIGGQVVGLLTGSTGLVLQNNGGDNLPITGNGTFTFDTPIANGSAYDVSTLTTPTPEQGCILWDWQGTATSDVTSIVVDCGHNDWTWMDGSNTANSKGSSTPPCPPTTGQNSSSPGGRSYAATWTDLSGNLWLFGGSGYYFDATLVTSAEPVLLNDLWEYTGTNSYFAGDGSCWELVSAPYDTGLVPSPSSREGAVTWTDASGNLWLFGGDDGSNFLNDLWKFNGTSWSLVSPVGTAPDGRWGANARFDGVNTVWMFGGEGYDSNGTLGLFNDLWTFNISSKQWALVAGTSAANQAGNYSTPGTPGGRKAAAAWLDTSGNFWVFGGNGLDSTGHPGALNDLWEYTGGQWAFVNGSNVGDQTGVYGTQGLAATTNVPGGRWDAAAWSDASGRLWLFGGQGYDSTGNGSLADLWEYTGGKWTWVKGPSSVSQAGVYGIGPNPIVWPYFGNYPGSRWGAEYWTLDANTAPLTGDSGIQFWMFGGEGFDSTGNEGDGLLNDLWRYLPYP